MRISKRLPKKFTPNALTKLLENLKRGSAPILDLTISNPTICGFDYPQDAIISAFASPEIFNYQPDPRGILSARAAISEMHGHGLEPGHIQLAASTSEAYSMLFKLLADPGDNILAPVPSYPLIEWLARLEGLKHRPVPALWHEGWHLDIDAVRKACDPRTRAIVAINPNNPTGQFLTETEWLCLLELATEKRLPIIVDEVFANYPLEPQDGALATVLRAAPPDCPVFLLSGLSKTAILPQLKLAWIAMLGAAAGAAGPLAFIADQYLSVSSATAHAAPQMLAMAPLMQGQVKMRLKENLAILDKHLIGQLHLSRLPVHGGWSALIQRPCIEDDEACALRLLSEHHLLKSPGHFFDIAKKGMLVASLLPEPSAFEKAVRALVEGLELNDLKTDFLA
jgi:aspartate/methionine/tyrosine aminotransferase